MITTVTITAAMAVSPAITRWIVYFDCSSDTSPRRTSSGTTVAAPTAANACTACLAVTTAIRASWPHRCREFARRMNRHSRDDGPRNLHERAMTIGLAQNVGIGEQGSNAFPSYLSA